MTITKGDEFILKATNERIRVVKIEIHKDETRKITFLNLATDKKDHAWGTRFLDLIDEGNPAREVAQIDL